MKQGARELCPATLGCPIYSDYSAEGTSTSASRKTFKESVALSGHETHNFPTFSYNRLFNDKHCGSNPLFTQGITVFDGSFPEQRKRLTVTLTAFLLMLLEGFRGKLSSGMSKKKLLSFREFSLEESPSTPIAERWKEQAPKEMSLRKDRPRTLKLRMRFRVRAPLHNKYRLLAPG